MFSSQCMIRMPIECFHFAKSYFEVYVYVVTATDFVYRQASCAPSHIAGGLWHIHCSMCSWGTGFDYYIIKAVRYYKYSWMAGNESTRSFHRYSSVWKRHLFIAYKKVCLFRNLNAKIDAFPFQKKKVQIPEQIIFVAWCFE